jgi:starvation-inducible DNA-binding protein
MVGFIMPRDAPGNKRLTAKTPFRGRARRLLPFFVLARFPSGASAIQSSVTQRVGHDGGRSIGAYPLNFEDTMHRTRIDLPADKREKLIGLLNAQLADILDLRMQSKQAHWNVRGPHFIGLHKLFDEVADALIEQADEIAERASMLGGVAQGTAAVVAERSRLPKYPLDIASGRKHIEAMSTALAAFAKTTRSAIEQAESLGDAGTADLLTQVVRETDKYLWFVEAHLQADD